MAAKGLREHPGDDDPNSGTMDVLDVEAQHNRATQGEKEEKKETDPVLSKSISKNKLPKLFLTRCDDCKGDPSCWDYVYDEKTRKHYRANMCIIERIKSGELPGTVEEYLNN